MKKLLLLFTSLLVFSTASIAQFKAGTTTNYNTIIGQSLIVDSIEGIPTGVSHFTVHFNSTKQNSFYNATSVNISGSKCQTQKGLQVKVYTDGTTTTSAQASDFKCDNYGNNGNPVHVASADSLIAIMKKYTELNAATADSARNQYWKPAACLFDKVKGDTTDLAFGCYPGMYKHVEYGFQFTFAGFGLSTDLSFTIDTYDPGNTGKTASYDLIVYIGSVSAANADTIKNFYVTGSGKKEVKLAEALGINYSAFSTQKVYIMLNTLGTDSEIAKGTYDPIIIFDDFKVSWGTPSWIAPPVVANQNYNLSGTGIYSTYTLNGTIGTIQLYLKDQGRVSAMKVTNDVESPPSLYQFKATDGVFANDGSGKYNVPVTYTFYPSVLNAETGNMSDSYISIPAPTSSTSDDIMVLMTFTPKQNSETIERVEIDNGVRFWWDVQTCSIAALPPVAIDKTNLNDITIHSSNGNVFVKGTKGFVTLYNAMGMKIGTFTANDAEKGIVTQKGIIIVSTSEGATKVLVR